MLAWDLFYRLRGRKLPQSEKHHAPQWEGCCGSALGGCGAMVGLVGWWLDVDSA